MSERERCDGCHRVKNPTSEFYCLVVNQNVTVDGCLTIRKKRKMEDES